MFNFFDEIKHQLIEVIEMDQMDSNEIVKKFDIHDNEIKNGAKLIVREGQQAIFSNNGPLADIFEAGTYELTTGNLPILTKLKSWKYGFDSPFKADVHYVSTRQIMDKWGTQRPITLSDKNFGMVRIRAFGEFTFRITNAEIFMRQILGAKHEYRVDEISGLMRSAIESKFAGTVGRLQIPMLELVQHYEDIGNALKEALNTEYSQWGITVMSFFVNNISLPDEVEKQIDKLTKQNMIGDKSTYMQLETIDIMHDMASNPKQGNGYADAAMNFAMGNQMGNMMAQAFANPQANQNNAQNNNNQGNNSQNNSTQNNNTELNYVNCTNCGKKVPKAKFCSECGFPLPSKKFCPNCGTEVTGKFCTECGTKAGE